ncbi:probable G-protein coupled receptor 141 isoform X2 [Chanodichthys erythropterus]
MIITNTTNTGLPEDFKISLFILHTFIFLSGTYNVLLMSSMLKSKRRLSFTKVSVMNLVAVHSIFLLTVPFRIYYCVFEIWNLGMYFCKIVSIMIHAHMYIAFILYVFLFILRYVDHSDQQHRLEFRRILHATIASAAVWLVIFGALFPTMANYGIAQNDSTQCFNFSQALQKPAVKRLNYVICILVIMIWSVLAFFQLFLLLNEQFEAIFQRQEFQAHLKNVVFLSFMFFCFVPYQGFRVYYVSEYGNTQVMDHINEVFLAVTAFSCFDMIVFEYAEL